MRSWRCMVGLIGATGILSGCAGWPLWANLPEDDAALPLGEDPRADVDVVWVPSGAQDISQPPGAPLLTASDAELVVGELRGVGWSDVAVPATLSGTESCPGDGVRAPLPGDWIGDVDVYRVDVPREGVLCARVAAADPETGLDLIAWRLSCDVPASLVEDHSGPVGLGGAGPVWGWAAPVAAGETISIVLAAYAPEELGRTIPYTLGVAIVDGPWCPLLPGEVVP